MPPLKRPFIFIFLVFGLKFFSQTDSTEGLNYLYKSAHKRGQAERAAVRNFGCSVFGGIGTAGNDLATGLAYGGSVRLHYGVHTLNAYGSAANGHEVFSLNGNYGGATYGFGFYGKGFCVGAGVGYAYSAVKISVGQGATYKELYYQRSGFCAGGQISFMYKYVGFGAQAYYNFTNARNDFTLMAGIEIRIWEDCLRKKPEEETITPAPR